MSNEYHNFNEHSIDVPVRRVFKNEEDEYGYFEVENWPIPAEILSVFEEYGSLEIEDYEYDEVGECVAILSFNGTTDSGGDMYHSFSISADNWWCPADWSWKFHEDVYVEFDPWNEAHLWLDDMGNPTEGARMFSDGESLYRDIKNYDDDVLSVIDAELGRLCGREFEGSDKYSDTYNETGEEIVLDKE